MVQYCPNNILVTGGAGFIGSVFIRFLLDNYKDIEITNLDALTYAGSKSNLVELPDQHRHTLVVGNICDRDLVAKLLVERRIDTIVHFAAESHVDRSISNPDDFVKTNIVGTYVLLEAASNLWLTTCGYSNNNCRFHHISTDEVYGSLSAVEQPFTELSNYAPNSPYAASKAASDHLVRAYHKTYGLPITISHCSNNYGPYQHKEKLIPKILQCCLHEQPIPIYGAGDNIRDWIYVADHCRAIDKVIRGGEIGETYNIGGNQEINNLELTKMICQLMDQQLPAKNSYHELISFVTDRQGHDFRYAIDSRKLTSFFPSLTFRSLADGLTEVVQWYLANDHCLVA